MPLLEEYLYGRVFVNLDRLPETICEGLFTYRCFKYRHSYIH